MKFKLYREYGALNSGPVFDALEKSLKKLNLPVVEKNEDVSVIWSVLWNGRMAQNQNIYRQNKSQGKHTLIIEVGNLKRGQTWRLCVNNVNKNGKFGNNTNLDIGRSQKLRVSLKPVLLNRRDDILIVGQHEKSLQWEGQPSMVNWLNATIDQVKHYTDRKIIVRPHPRCPLRGNIIGGQLIVPKKINGTYDDYDIEYNYHCVINFNSGPAVQAAINGVPIICDQSSLAYAVSDKLENIENIQLMDRESWFLKLVHTEWLVEEIAQGEPLERLLSDLV